MAIFTPDTKLKCPVGGEEWPARDYKSVVDATAPKQTPKTVKFWCPSQHDFTLARALRAGMFTEGQAAIMIAAAQEAAQEFQRAMKEKDKDGLQKLLDSNRALLGEKEG